MTVYSNKRRAIIVGPETPVTSKETDVWVNTDTGQILRYNGAEWVIAAANVEYVQTASSYVNVLANDYSDSQLESASIAIMNDLNDSNTALQAYINASSTYLETTLNNNINSASANLVSYTNDSLLSASTNLISYTDLEILELQNLANNNLIVTENSLISTINTASIASVSEANSYTDTEIQNLNLITNLINASAAAVSYADSLTTSDIQELDNLYFTNQRAIDAGSATYLSQSDAALNYLSLANGGNVSGPVDFESSVTFSGSVTYINTENLLIDDPLIYLAQNNTESDTLDSGFTTAYGEAAAFDVEYSGDWAPGIYGFMLNNNAYEGEPGWEFANYDIGGVLLQVGTIIYFNSTATDTQNNIVQPNTYYEITTDGSTIYLTQIFPTSNTGENHLHRGLVYDNSDNRWKLASNFPHPSSNVIDFSNATYEEITLGSASVSGTVNVTGSVSASAFIGDGSQLTGINLATKKDKLNTFDQETANYVLILSNADQIVEMNVATANTLTVPPNSSVPFPIGTELTVLQTGSGQTTLTPGSGVTINGTPGLKLRAQWSSAMLVKRGTDTWVAIGDLSA